MLEAILPKIDAGGQCLFQTVADQTDYGFDADEYLASASPEMEVHSLPMAAIIGDHARYRYSHRYRANGFARPASTAATPFPATATDDPHGRVA